MKKRNDFDVLSFFKLSLGNINAKNNEGYTPLHLIAMKAEKVEFVKLMYDLGADKNIETEFGERAYDLAKENEKLNVNLGDLDFLK